MVISSTFLTSSSSVTGFLIKVISKEEEEARDEELVLMSSAYCSSDAVRRTDKLNGAYNRVLSTVTHLITNSTVSGGVGEATW